MADILFVGDTTTISRPDNRMLSPFEEEDRVGHLLWQLAHARTGISQADYIELFDRRCLVRGFWDVQSAIDYWDSIKPFIFANYAYILIVGTKARMALGASELLPELGIVGNLAYIPKTLPMNIFFHQRYTRAAAEILMEEMVLRATE